jgi:lysophospholipase L1-like esterase
MAIRLTRRVAIAAVLCGLATPAAADDKPVKIVMVGDSTMASYANPPADRPDLTGWGQVFGDFFTEKVAVVNLAASGRTTASFVKEGRWAKALEAKPDYVFIQFGHNDQKVMEAKGEYRDNLRRYVDEAVKAGARPVLVTPVARRTFQDGKPVTTLTPFADVTKEVAKEKGVPVIDLHQLAFDLYAKLGDEGSADLTAAKTDRTHFSRKGALAIAGLVAGAIPEAVPGLKPYLKK